MTSMTDLLNDCYRRGNTVRILVAGVTGLSGVTGTGGVSITGTVSDVTTDLVEVINTLGETLYIRIRSIDVVALAP